MLINVCNYGRRQVPRPCIWPSGHDTAHPALLLASLYQRQSKHLSNAALLQSDVAASSRGFVLHCKQPKCLLTPCRKPATDGSAHYGTKLLTKVTVSLVPSLHIQAGFCCLLFFSCFFFFFSIVSSVAAVGTSCGATQNAKYCEICVCWQRQFFFFGHTDEHIRLVLTRRPGNPTQLGSGCSQQSKLVRPRHKEPTKDCS